MPFYRYSSTPRLRRLEDNPELPTKAAALQTTAPAVIIKNLSKVLLSNIGLRIFSYLAAAIIVAAVILNFIFYKIQEKQMILELHTHGKSIASLFAENIRAGVYSQSIDLLEPPANSLLRQPGLVSVCIYNDRNELLYFSTNEFIDKVAAGSDCDLGNYREVTDASRIGEEGSLVFQEKVSTAVNSDQFYGVQNPQQAQQAIGTVLIRLSAEKLVERRRTLLNQSIVICLSFLAILLPLTFVIVNESTRPLKKLLIRLRSRLPPRNGKTTDIDSLDQTFSTMLGELEDSFRTIESLKNQLEKKVEERTEELQRINKNLEKTVVELKEAQMQLIHSEKMASLGLLATGLAHEINNALTMIKGSFFPLRRAIDQLEAHCRKDTRAAEKEPGETTVAELFHFIDTGVFRIATLLKDLMTFARPGPAARKLIDVNNELEMTLRLLNVVSGKEIEFVRDFSRVHPVFCRESQIAQVFFNILLNAIQAIETRGRIRIGTAVEDDFVVVVFADNGRGIEPEILEKIFDPFFTTKETGSGTGLGLSICYAIINEHGGKIEVASEMGKGTVFTIKLPKCSSPPPAGAGYE